MQTLSGKTSSLKVSIADNSQLAEWFEYAETMLDIKQNSDNLLFYIQQLKKLAGNLELKDLYSMIDLATYSHLNIEIKDIRSLAPVRLNKLIQAYRNRSEKNNSFESPTYTQEQEAEIHVKFLETLKNGFQKYRETNEMPVMTPIYVYQFYVKQGLIQPDEELKNEINTRQENLGNSIGAIMRRSMQGYEFQKIKEFYDDLISEGKELELYEAIL